MCHSCCTTWPRAALPTAYLPQAEASQFLRVCFGCDVSASAFRIALLSGDLAAVRTAYGGGYVNVNLRAPLPHQGEVLRGRRVHSNPRVVGARPS
eukprot:981982-Prymnesium_polylepis.1